MYTSVLTDLALLTTGTFSDPSIYICSRDDSGSSPAWSCVKLRTGLNSSENLAEDPAEDPAIQFGYMCSMRACVAV